MSVPLIPAALTPDGHPTLLGVVQVSGSTSLPARGLELIYNASSEEWVGEHDGIVFTLGDVGGNWVVEEDGVAIGTKVNSATTPIGSYTTQALLTVFAIRTPGALQPEVTLSPGAPGSLIPEV